MEVWFRLYSFLFFSDYIFSGSSRLFGGVYPCNYAKVPAMRTNTALLQRFPETAERKTNYSWPLKSLQLHSCASNYYRFHPLYRFTTTVFVHSSGLDQKQKLQSFVLVPSFTDVETTYQHQRLMFYYQIKAQCFIIKHQSSRSTSSTSTTTTTTTTTSTSSSTTSTTSTGSSISSDLTHQPFVARQEFPEFGLKSLGLITQCALPQMTLVLIGKGLLFWKVDSPKIGKQTGSRYL